MTSSVLVGLAVTPRDDEFLNTAKFDNVSTTATGPASAPSGGGAAAFVGLNAASGKAPLDGFAGAIETSRSAPGPMGAILATLALAGSREHDSAASDVAFAGEGDGHGTPRLPDWVLKSLVESRGPSPLGHSPNQVRSRAAILDSLAIHWGFEDSRIDGAFR
jgi:hypothetical protein